MLLANKKNESNAKDDEASERSDCKNNEPSSRNDKKSQGSDECSVSSRFGT